MGPINPVRRAQLQNLAMLESKNPKMMTLPAVTRLANA
jgi:hypothetical protein